jgi:hypothetical protein
MSTLINKLYMFFIALDAIYDYLLTSETTTTLYYSIHLLPWWRCNLYLTRYTTF